MRVVMLGPPGAGKGSYASRLTVILKVPHISTGDMVREEIKSKTRLWKKIKEYSDKGELVPDEIMIHLLAKRLKKSDTENGFILDGFPRTTKQAVALDEISKVDLVINLNVPDEIIIQRLSNRISCKKCGAIYNQITLIPKKEGLCDKCGGKIYQREDDKPEVVQERLNVYRKKSKHLIKHYRRRGLVKDVYCDDLITPPEVIVEEIMKIINRLKKMKKQI